MSPYEAIEAHYGREGVAFDEEIARYQQHGFASWNRDFFLMAVPVRLADLRGHPWRVSPAMLAGEDTWLIGGMAGDMSKAWAAEPYPLPWFAFERGKRLHIVRRDRIRRLTSRHLVISA